MHIVNFTNTYLPHVGGVAHSVARFTEDLRRRGHRVLVVAPVYPGSEDADAADPDVLRVPAVQKFNGSDFSMRIRLPFLIDEAIDRFAPDVIHSHHPYLLGDAAVRAAKRRCLPLIFTHHTRYEEYTHYVTPDSEKMKQFAVNLATEYANMCDRVVAPSRSIADLIRERGVQAPIVCIPTGVDTATFADGDGACFRKRHGIEDAALVVGHVGRLAPEKNLDFLARALTSTLTRCRKAVFVLVGDGPARKDVAGALHAEGLAERLFQPGKLSGRALTDAYGAMDLFAFTSRSETQGMVVTEAMAAGVPVAALDAPGVREVVADGRNGRLLTSEATAEEFAEAIAAVLKDRRKRRELAAGARRTARRFDRRTTTGQLAELYEKARSDRAMQDPRSEWESPPWDALLNAIRVEWDLLSAKTSAVAAAVGGGPENSAESSPEG